MVAIKMNVESHPIFARAVRLTIRRVYPLRPPKGCARYGTKLHLIVRIQF